MNKPCYVKCNRSISTGKSLVNSPQMSQNRWKLGSLTVLIERLQIICNRSEY